MSGLGWEGKMAPRLWIADKTELTWHADEEVKPSLSGTKDGNPWNKTEYYYFVANKMMFG